MAGGSTSGLFFPVLSADGLHKAQTAINPYFGDGCVNPRRSTQRAAFHLGSRYTATRCAPRTRGGPRRNCSWCATCGDGARLTQRPGLRAFVGREEPLRCSEVCGFPVTPRSFFLPLSRRIPILRDQMIPAVLLHYLKVVVFSFFFPSLTFCVCVCAYLSAMKGFLGPG